MNERADTATLMSALEELRVGQEQRRDPLRDLDAEPPVTHFGSSFRPSSRLAEEAKAGPPRKRSFWAALWRRILAEWLRDRGYLSKSAA